MFTRKLFWQVIFVFVLGSFVLLLATPKRSQAGSPIDGSLVISEAAEQEVAPSTAYNSTRQEYLAVWYNDRAGCDDIRAQRLSKSGAKIGGPFYISAACSDDRRFPDVIYNQTSDQYLIVWEQYLASKGYSIQAKRVSGTGQVLDTNNLIIRDWGYNLYTPAKPAVSYAFTSDRYLVVWSEIWHPLPITHTVYGQVVDASGNLDGGKFVISEGSEDRSEPDVAYNRHANRYLVVWQYDAGPLWDIHGQQVHGGGGLFQGDITIAYYTRSSTAPAVAAIPTSPTDYKFLVAWEIDYAANNHDIYSRLIAEDGTPHPSDTKISLTNQDETSPAIASSEVSGQYFLTWRHPQGVIDKPIRGQVISNQGVLLGQKAEFSGVAADLPAVAAGPAGDFLVAWQDQPVSATNTNIYGQLWGNRTYLPLGLRNYP